MPDQTYDTPTRKELIFLFGEIKTPPFSASARKKAGDLLRSVQDGERLGLPASRPLPSLGPRCHELRVTDENVTWRILYRIDPDAVVVSDVFAKKTEAIPRHILNASRHRLATYDRRAG
ncbi:MAG TPA: type II toxin-antitoxin system RelE/ParE family toxin [Longimicrobium sp.]|jgi:phage-related protein|nr:type II toxin-antitoxin system RelE/ParE family toxin [Longimicrobium sp.]